MSVPVPVRVGDGQPATNVAASNVAASNVVASNVAASNVAATVLTNADLGAQPPDHRRIPAVYPEPDAEPWPNM